jgi:iron complex outermembrane receptor protein
MRRKLFILATTSTLALAITPVHAQTSPAQAGEGPNAPGPLPADPAAATGVAPNQAQTDTGSPSESVAEETGQDVVVTGFRQSLASSRNLKRQAPQVVDAVVAEDIGKLPDLAVSDTAARIPGVQVLRLGGEASQVLIRGLPEAFFNTLYNGREIFTAERRQVALQDFPSAGIAALEVFKTSTAEQVDPGVVGLTNVRSRRPFDIAGFQVAGNVWGLHTTQSGRVTPNGNILVSDRWNTGVGEMGLLVNLSYTQLKYLDSEAQNTDFIANPVVNGQEIRVPDIQRLYYRSGDRKRPSANAAFQWKPSDTLQFYAEGLYQGFRNAVDDTQAQVPLYSDSAGTTAYSNLAFRPGTNLVSSGTVTNPGGTITSFRGGTYNKTDTYQFAAGAIFDSGPLRLTADVARSKSTFKGSTESVDREFGVGGYTVDFNSDTPEFNIRGINAGDPSSYRFLGLYEESQESKGDDWQARVDGEYKFDGSILRSLQFGARYTTRDAHREFGNRYAQFAGRNIMLGDLPINFVPVRPGFKGTDVQSDFRTFLAPTYNSIRDNIVEFRRYIIGLGVPTTAPSFGTFTEGAPAIDPIQTYDASEKTYAGYGQVNYNFNDLVDGTIGVRVVRTETDVAGNASVGGVVTPITQGPEFTDWLPNASLRWHVTPSLQLRLAYSKTRTRPDFGQLNPSVTVGSPDPTNGNLRTGSGGNPDLQPFRSNNYDASLEWYFSPTGFASAAVFRRDLNGFVQTESNRFTDPVLGLVQISRPVNSGSGRIDGVEAQLSTFFDFDFLPEIVRNFGIQANYTYLDAATQFADAGNSNVLTLGPIQGVSKHSYNIVGLFERGPVSLRLTYNGRTKFLDFRQARTDEATGFYNQYGRPADRLDLSANLRFTPAATLFFDATNLTGSADRYTFTSARAGAPEAEYVRFLRFQERTFSVGLRFRFGA